MMKKRVRRRTAISMFQKLETQHVSRVFIVADQATMMLFPSFSFCHVFCFSAPHRPSVFLCHVPALSDEYHELN